MQVHIRKKVVFTSADIISALVAYGYDIPKKAQLSVASGPDGQLEDCPGDTIAIIWQEMGSFDRAEEYSSER